MSKIILSAILNSYRPLTDKSWSLNFNIGEPSIEQREIIHSMHQNLVAMLVKDVEDITKEEETIIESIGRVKPKKMTPSQELRFTIKMVWEEDNKGLSFEDYYLEEIKKLNKHYKDKIKSLRGN